MPSPWNWQSVEVLKAWPETQKLRKTAWINFALTILFFAGDMVLHTLSEAPALPPVSQLCFSAPFVKADLMTSYTRGKILFYVAFQAIDYGFMVVYALCLWAACLLCGRKHLEEKGEVLGNLLLRAHRLGPFAALFDAVENLFIFLILSQFILRYEDPYVDQGLVVARSVFALVKWILLLYVVGLLAISRIVRCFPKKQFNKIRARRYLIYHGIRLKGTKLEPPD